VPAKDFATPRISIADSLLTHLPTSCGIYEYHGTQERPFGSWVETHDVGSNETQFTGAWGVLKRDSGVVMCRPGWSDTLRWASETVAPEGVPMTKVADFHTTGIEDVDELVFHNQSECPIGQEVKKKGTAAPGQGYFRTLCVKCKSIEEGWEANRPL